MKRRTPYYFLIVLVYCLSGTLSAQTAQNIIDKAIEVHGGEDYQNGHFSYDFRDKHYELIYDHGNYQYTREFTDKDGSQIKDILSNKGFVRFKNGKSVKLEQKKIDAYSNSVNSVHYFAYLPFYLNDAAVNKKKMDDTRINGQDYHQIQVTFQKEGGGTDYDDVYMYWIHADNYTMDYLAYSYHVEEGGVRFREAYNPQVIGGVRWQDYVNYKHDKDTPPIEMVELFQKGELIELSKIELRNIATHR